MNAKARLALAIRRLNLAYSRLTDPDSRDFLTDTYRQLERQVDTALCAGDDRAAITAIEEWETHTLNALETSND